jgi:hypothetical protein
MKTFAPKDLLPQEIFYLGKAIAYMVMNAYAEVDYYRLSRILRVDVTEPDSETDASRLFDLVRETAWNAGLR